MLADIIKKDEKKVEYIELIYDLIFVYIIGRNNSLLHTIVDGFIPLETYATFILSTLVILQIWYFTTLFINRYGSNGIAEYTCLFINMYLLYYMADSTRVSWQAYYDKYTVAWALILINLAIQYLIKLKKSGGLMPWQSQHIRLNIIVLFSQAAMILISIPIYHVTQLPFAPLAMVFGIVSILLFRNVNRLMSVDFPHLTERVMLYVVFTFGEMIIGIAGYFDGGVSFTSIYFSLMAFLIVAGLFLIYGYFYDHIIDRELQTTGTGYMMLHIFLIAALNNVTVALEFMREEQVDTVKKNVFLAASFLVYFAFLLSTQRYAKCHKKPNAKLVLTFAGTSLLFIGGMALFYQNSWVSIAITVVYIYAMLGICVFRGEHRKSRA